jgi:pSer/pThr/pTyr-binding forkhead associated (FHA) protein
MAILTKADGTLRMALAAHCLLGRAPVCTLRLEEPVVSSEHAVLSYAGGAWSVRDLGSRNGTFVDGARLEPGEMRPLAQGTRLGFGTAAPVWTLADASPPVAMARRLATDEFVAGEESMLVLPSAEEPAACVFERDGAWVVEVDGQERPAADGDVIQAGGQAFMLHLPNAHRETVVVAPTLGIDDVEIRIQVTPDEEHVEVTVVAPGRSFALPRHAHHYTLLTLARARLRDEAAPDVGAAQRGWVPVEDLCRALRIDEGRLAVEIFRIRRDFAALGLVGAASVIERRRGSRQIRVATARIAVAVIG